MPEITERAEDAADALAEVRAHLRPELAELSAYVPHTPAGIELRLDANEAPPPSIGVREAAMRGAAQAALERYPDPGAMRLKAAIAMRTGARAEDLLVGSGSDEVIALLFTALARPRDRSPQPVVLTPTPTFVMYRVTARAHGWKPVEVPLDASWDLDAAGMARAAAMVKPNLVFVASPNNPTGNVMSEDRLRSAVAGAKDALFVVDEAYVDYAGPSVRPLRSEHAHLAILRTLSKIGLAGLRVGWLEADPSLVREVDKARQPFNLSATSQAAAAAVLEDAWEEVLEGAARVVRSRLALATAVAALDGFGVTTSGANFLWVKTPGPAEAVFDHLVADKILVRSFHGSGGRLASQLRITVGTSEANERVVASLARFRRSA